jgi:hypothetical protein
MKTTTLIKNAFRAMVFPHRVFKEIKDGDRINYKIVIPLMVLSAPLLMQLHSIIIYERFLIGKLASALLIIPIYSVASWIVGSMILHLLATIFKKDVELYSIEIAVFYLWMVAAVSPFMDFPHLFDWEARFYNLGWIRGTLRFSLIPVVILLITETFFLLKHLLKFKSVAALLFALSVPFATKVFVGALGIPNVLHNIFRLLYLSVGAWEVLLISYTLIPIVTLCPAILYRRHIIKTGTKAKRKESTIPLGNQLE